MRLCGKLFLVALLDFSFAGHQGASLRSKPVLRDLEFFPETAELLRLRRDPSFSSTETLCRLAGTLPKGCLGLRHLRFAGTQLCFTGA